MTQGALRFGGFTVEPFVVADLNQRNQFSTLRESMRENSSGTFWKQTVEKRICGIRREAAREHSPGLQPWVRQ
jgi:hypothetical protein